MGFDTNLQKEIWLKHIEVQERVLQLNSVPIAIKPETILISGQRLKLRVCQTDELDTKIDRVKSFFGVSDDAIDNNNDTIVCDARFNPDPYDISQLAEDCQKHYIQLSRNPIIEGVIRSQKSTFTKCVKILKNTETNMLLIATDDSRSLWILFENWIMMPIFLVTFFQRSPVEYSASHQRLFISFVSGCPLNATIFSNTRMSRLKVSRNVD